MPTLTIQIDDATAARLEALAQSRGTTPEREIERATNEWVRESASADDRRALMLDDAREFMDSHAEDFKRLAS